MEESNIEGVFAVDQELESWVQQEKLKQDFYDEKYYLSPSALSKYLWRPQAWYDWYVLKRKEDRKDTKASIQGSLIHLLILQPEKFGKRYCISKEGLVKDKQKEVLDRLFWLLTELCDKDDPEDEIRPLTQHKIGLLAVMEEADYYQSIKDYNARFNKMVTPQAEEYWEFLRKSAGKILISQEQYNFCKKMAEKISKNQEYRELLGMDSSGEDEVYNELDYKCDTGYQFGFRGILDNLCIRHSKKEIVLNDIKTTSKTLKEFAEQSIAKYDIDIQLALYTAMIIKLVGEDRFLSYGMRINIIAVTEGGDTYAFPVSQGTADVWVNKLKEALEDFNWSFENKDFSNHRVFLEKNYIL